MRKPKVDFRPYEKDLAKVMGELEAEVMRALWTKGSGSLKEIHGEVTKRKDVAITTVGTILDRLYDKGLVKRSLKKDKGLYYQYSPAYTEDEFKKKVASSVLEGLFESFGPAAASYLIEEIGIKDAEKIKELKRYLDKLKEGK